MFKNYKKSINFLQFLENKYYYFLDTKQLGKKLSTIRNKDNSIRVLLAIGHATLQTEGLKKTCLQSFHHVKGIESLFSNPLIFVVDLRYFKP